MLTYLMSTSSWSPYGPWERPMPVCLIPPQMALRLDERVHVVVDRDRPRLEPFGEPGGPLPAPRPDRGRQPVPAVVGQGHGLFGRVEGHDRQGRPERLLGHDLHGVVDTVEDRRLEEIAGKRGDPVPPDKDRGRPWPGRRRCASSTMSSWAAVAMGPMSTPASSGSPTLTSASELDDPGRERPDDLAVDIGALDRAAALAAVHEGRPDGAAGGPLEVGVLEHDHGVLAAELEGHVGQVPAAELHDPPADPDAAREHDGLDVRVGRSSPRPGGCGRRRR